MTDDEFNRLWTGADPGPEPVGCMVTTLLALGVLFWASVILWAVIV